MRSLSIVTVAGEPFGQITMPHEGVVEFSDEDTAAVWRQLNDNANGRSVTDVFDALASGGWSNGAIRILMEG